MRVLLTLLTIILLALPCVPFLAPIPSSPHTFLPSSSSSSNYDADAVRLAIEEQQALQIKLQQAQVSQYKAAGGGEDLLAELSIINTANNANTANKSTSRGSPNQLSQTPKQAIAPLKVSLFIDGTWLYYSIYSRGQQSAIPVLFGESWANTHTVNWQLLPTIIVEGIREQLNKNCWHTKDSLEDRPIEITAANVFTSMKPSTDPNSLRSKMFADMAKCNFDVHMMETEGEQVRKRRASRQCKARALRAAERAVIGSKSVTSGPKRAASGEKLAIGCAFLRATPPNSAF